MAIAQLTIDLTARLAELETGFAKAALLADKNAKTIERSFTGLNKGIEDIGKKLAGLFAVREMVRFVHDVNAGVAALEDLSTATGASVENLSALEDIGRRTGNSFDTVAATVLKFNKALEGAKKGDDVSRTFEALGLSVKELQALDPAEALRRTAVAMQGFANSAELGRANITLFGKGTREMAPFMKDVATQQKLIGTVTDEAAKAAKDFDDQINALKKDLLDFARTVVPTVADATSFLIGKLRELNEWRDKRLAENDASAERNRITTLEGVNRALAQAGQSQDYYNHFLAERNRLEEMDPARRREAKLREGAGARGGPGLQGDLPLGTLKVADEATKAKVSAYDKYLERLRDIIIAEKTAGSVTQEVDRLRLELAKDPELANAGAKRIALLFDEAAAADALKNKMIEFVEISERTKALRADKASYGADAFKDAGMDVAKLDRQIALFRSTLADPSRDKIAQEVELREYLEALKKTGLTAEEAEARVRSFWASGAEGAVEAKNNIDIALEDIAASIDETLGQGLEAMLTGHFDSIGKLFQRMLEQMAVKALQANLMDSLFGAMGAGGTRAGGGWVSAFMGAIGFGGTRASGGLVAPFSLTQVNDQAGTGGAEGFSTGGKDFLMTGSKGGRVTQAGAGGAAVVQVNIAAGVSRNEVAALIPALKSQIKAEVIAAMRRPGFSGG